MALPEPADAGAGREPLKKVPAEHRAAARQALLDTLVLLPVIIWFLLDATETVDMAIVMLIVVVTLLRQADPPADARLEGDLWPRMRMRLDRERLFRLTWFDRAVLVLTSLGLLFYPKVAAQVLAYL